MVPDVLYYTHKKERMFVFKGGCQMEALQMCEFRRRFSNNYKFVISGKSQVGRNFCTGINSFQQTYDAITVFTNPNTVIFENSGGQIIIGVIYEIECSQSGSSDDYTLFIKYRVGRADLKLVVDATKVK